VWQGEVQQRVQELFADIAEQYDIPLEEIEVSPDHVHIFCSFPPRYSIAQGVTRFKSLRARAIFREFPRVKRRSWGGEFWEDGYFARTVSDRCSPVSTLKIAKGQSAGYSAIATSHFPED
jgi:putative transposase